MMKKITTENTLYRSWQRVEENRGCRGSDGVTIGKYNSCLHENLESLSHDLLSCKYYPFPLLRFSVPKPKGKGVRWLNVPTVRDRVAQTAVSLVTGPAFEDEFETVIHAYRQGRGVHTAVRAISALQEEGYAYAMDADIEGFFDNIPHDLLIEKVQLLFPDQPPLWKLFEKWIKAETWDGEHLDRFQKGIPQGSVVSPLLANLFLDSLDEFFIDLGFKLVRYADDFLVLSKTRAEAEDFMDITELLLEEMQLDLNPEKTKIVSFEGGFKFLGALFLNDGVYQPFPQKKSNRPFLQLPDPLTLKTYIELKHLDE
ncbi:RNA-directed DNA polymerase [bacterium]|nr:RNA-directed DNA polymerase [bacterium]